MQKIPTQVQAGLRVPLASNIALGNADEQVALCIGNCDASGNVTVDEIITLVNIALGNAQPSACRDGVPSGDVTVAVIMQAVNNALNGCAAPYRGECGTAGTH